MEVFEAWVLEGATRFLVDDENILEKLEFSFEFSRLCDFEGGISETSGALDLELGGFGAFGSAVMLLFSAEKIREVTSEAMTSRNFWSKIWSIEVGETRGGLAKLPASRRGERRPLGEAKADFSRGFSSERPEFSR